MKISLILTRRGARKMLSQSEENKIKMRHERSFVWSLTLIFYYVILMVTMFASSFGWTRFGC